MSRYSQSVVRWMGNTRSSFGRSGVRNAAARASFSLHLGLPDGGSSRSFYTRPTSLSTSSTTVRLTVSGGSYGGAAHSLRLLASLSGGASSAPPRRSDDMDAFGSAGPRWRTRAHAKVGLTGLVLAAGVIAGVLATDRSDGLDFPKIDTRSMHDAARFAQSVSHKAGEAAIEVADHVTMMVAAPVRGVLDLLSYVTDGLITLGVLVRSVRAVLGVDLTEDEDDEEELEMVRPMAGGRLQDSAKQVTTVRRKTSWFAPRVGALIADLASCRRRRYAIATSADGAVVDWLLESLVDSDCWRLKLEASRALASLIKDDSVRDLVLSRTHAIPILLQYVSTAPSAVGSRLIEKQVVASKADSEDRQGDLMKGKKRPHGTEGDAIAKWPLLSVIFDLVTCDHCTVAVAGGSDDDDGDGVTRSRRHVALPAEASMEDICAAVNTLTEGLVENVGGGSPFNGQNSGTPPTGRRGGHGIGMGVLGDTAIVGQKTDPTATVNGAEHARWYGAVICQGGAVLGREDGSGYVRVVEKEGRSQFLPWYPGIEDLVQVAVRRGVNGLDGDDDSDLGRRGVWRGLISWGLGLSIQEGEGRSGSVQAGMGASSSSSSDLSIADPSAIVGQALAVSLAAWALASWATASSTNCSKIAAADVDGEAVKLAVLAKQRSVKWHGIKAAQRVIMEGGRGSEEVGEKWTKALMTVVACSTGTGAGTSSGPGPGTGTGKGTGTVTVTVTGTGTGTGKSAQLSLAAGYDSTIICLALEALTSCVTRSKAARRWMFETGLPQLREMLKATEGDKEIERRASALVALLVTTHPDGQSLSLDEFKKWTPVLLRWACGMESESETRGCAVGILHSTMKSLGQGRATIGQAWLASMLTTMVVDFPAAVHLSPSVGLEVTGEDRGGKKPAPTSVGIFQSHILKQAASAAARLAQVVVQDSAAAAAAAAAAGGEDQLQAEAPSWTSATVAQSVWRSGEDWLGGGSAGSKASTTAGTKKPKPVPAVEAAAAVSKALKAMSDLSSADVNRQRYIVDAGGVYLLRSMIIGSDYAKSQKPAEVGAPQPGSDIPSRGTGEGTRVEGLDTQRPVESGVADAPTTKGTTSDASASETQKMKKQALRLLAMISTHTDAGAAIAQDELLCSWLTGCADGRTVSADLKTCSYCRAILFHVAAGEKRNEETERKLTGLRTKDSRELVEQQVWPRFEDGVYLVEQTEDLGKAVVVRSTGVPEGLRKGRCQEYLETVVSGVGEDNGTNGTNGTKRRGKWEDAENTKVDATECRMRGRDGNTSGTDIEEGAGGSNLGPESNFDKPVEGVQENDSLLRGDVKVSERSLPVMDVVFIHGLCGGPFKTWRVAGASKNSAESKSKQEANAAAAVSQGKPAAAVTASDSEYKFDGDCWPTSWLADDIKGLRMLTLKYKTNLSEWSGATLPLNDVSSHLLQKLVAAGVGKRPFVFVTHSMGGLIAKQMIASALEDPRYAEIARSLRGVVFYSCPHFGSRLADVPWRIGYVLRPAPSIWELRSRSPRLEELNKTLRQMQAKGQVSILSFCESASTPLVEGYAGLALRMEVVPMESAYPGFGDVVVLEGTDHVNACKPQSRTDTAYVKTVDFLKNLKMALEREQQR
ncbi:hypothetical protein CBR_g45541 [Chara braunii]|uniref:DUF676 domain-containing protein n=1 Tax=Chara braunii TaxID=69332 RepID=A0A388LZ22_CHABU|nr:hypothetical protein CBR_g45541 [Chara braunii]|eukprot:GBG87482.1 hypothetical protein CBR_g45541 [Chara braunii]